MQHGYRVGGIISLLTFKHKFSSVRIRDKLMNRISQNLKQGVLLKAESSLGVKNRG